LKIAHYFRLIHVKTASKSASTIVSNPNGNSGFKLCSAVVSNETQIHTHMCYAEFNNIFPWIAAMDANVISMEVSVDS